MPFYTYIISGLVGLLAIGGVYFGFNTLNSDNVGAFNDAFISLAVGSSPTNGYVLQTDGTDSTWVATSTLGITADAGFGQAWEVGTNIFSESSLAPTTTINIDVNGVGTSTFAGGLEAWRQIAAPYFHATSTATSTFAGGIDLGTNHIRTHGAISDASDGLHLHAANGTTVGTFGAGNTANALFSGAVNVTGNLGVLTGSSFTVTDLTSALTLTNGSGVFAEYAGTSCTNQFVRSLSALGVATCETVANTDLANSTISGISLGSNLADLTATDATLTFSGAYNGGTARTIGLNLGNANTWTALQTFANASTTLGSFDYASSTLYYGAGLQTCNATTGKLAWANGQFTCETDQSGGASFGQAWEQISTNYLAPTTTISIAVGTTTSNNLGLSTLTLVPTSTATTNLIQGLDYSTGAELFAIDTSGRASTTMLSSSGTIFSDTFRGIGATVDFADSTFTNYLELSGSAIDFYGNAVTYQSVDSYTVTTTGANGITFNGGDSNYRFLGNSVYGILDFSNIASSNKTITWGNFSGTPALGSYTTGFTNGDIAFGSSGLLATSTGFSFNNTNDRLTVTYASSTALSATTLEVDTNFGFLGTIYSSLATFGTALVEAITSVSPTGIWNFGGATSVEIPNGASPTVDTTGEIAVDTTTGQFKWSYNDASVGILPVDRAFGITYATSSQAAATSTKYLGVAPYALTVNEARCDFSNFMGISLFDGTNRADYFVASSTIGQITFTTNNTFTLGEAIRVDVGTSTATSADVRGGCTFFYTVTAD